MTAQMVGDPLVSDDGEQTWSMVHEAGRLWLRFPHHVTSRIAAEAVDAVAATLRSVRTPQYVIADLSVVDSFDVGAPMAAVRAGRDIRPHIVRVELIVRHTIVRIAALSAAHVLGIPCTVREV